MMKFLLNNKYILIFVGFSIVLYILYLRLFVTRIPKDFTYNQELYIFVSLLMCIFFSMLLMIKLYIYINQDNVRVNIEVSNSKLNRVWSYIKQKVISFVIFIKTLIDESLFQLDNTLIKALPFSGNIVEYCARFLLHLELYPERLLFWKRFIFFGVPLVFICEIVIYHRLDFFYKILIVLVIPLIINYVIFSIRCWYKYQITGMNKIVNIELIDFVEKTIVTPSAFATYFCMVKDDQINFNVHFLPEIEEYRKSQGLSIQENLNSTGNFLLFLSNVLSYLLYYDNATTSYNKTIISIIPMVLYTVGWLYIFTYLYYGISIGDKEIIQEELQRI